MSVRSSGRWLVLAVALSQSACAQDGSNGTGSRINMEGATEIGRTINGHTYTNAPVEVKLGPNTFRIPANYLDSQIAPWPGEGVTLVIEWPDMKSTPPGARADPRTNDFRKEITALVDYIDRVPIETLLAVHASTDRVTVPGSIESRDPRDRLDLRMAQPEVMGLTPYAIDEMKMAAFSKEYEAREGKPPIRNPAFEEDWYVARDAKGQLTTFIKCDNHKFLPNDGVRLEGRQIVDDMVGGVRQIASCTQRFVDIENKLSFSVDYYRVYLKDWQRIQEVFLDLMRQSKAR
ncbi:hypothetical protein EA658_14785 [Pseudoxanthomonas winnipegensis]|uniref:Uncharacterized protein n=1 Tax=Pseudoxanthomonas winnipegensis TaxID=2480810 RepID=A0ABY1WBJ7_9GAMM|nr:hypothetical protein [Pseudoxanthomonas winnipegensis]TAA10955.1 hypothetical protein EA659_06195 [Pseudoxanthomonas winnipegensis]TAA18381.1 hypothetical protein EA658_14785 [Pseudoxanthomonas winnipegensis]TAH74245.1 hypothetical protein EA657_01965 [Pseudoxanthomonas winnipegensis]